MEWKRADSLVKKGAVASKEGHAESILGHKRPIIIDLKKKPSHIKRKHADSEVKKEFQVQWSVKKVMLTAFLDIKRSITIDSKKKTQQN